MSLSTRKLESEVICLDIKITVSKEKISNALISALEGGSNYWYEISETIEPNLRVWQFENDNGDRFKKEGKHWIQDYPLNAGGALIIDDISEEDGSERHQGKKLDINAIGNGLRTMAAKFPQHFGDLLSDEGDADTGDIFLQCCLFGDVIYG